MQRVTSFGKTLRTTRKQRGQTLWEVADMAGISAGYLSMLERDKAPTSPSKAVVLELADALHLDGDELMAMSGRIADDILGIILNNPREISQLLFAVQGMSGAEVEAIAANITQRRKGNPPKKKR